MPNYHKPTQKTDENGNLIFNKKGISWFGHVGNSLEVGITVDPIIGNMENRNIPRFKWVDMERRYREKEEAKEERLKEIREKLKAEEQRAKEEEAAQREIDAKRRDKKAKKLKVKDPTIPKYYKTKIGRTNKPKLDKKYNKWNVQINVLGKVIYFGRFSTLEQAQKVLDEKNRKKFALLEKLDIPRMDARTDRTRTFISDYLKKNCQTSYNCLLALYGKDNQVF